MCSKRTVRSFVRGPVRTAGKCKSWSYTSFPATQTRASGGGLIFFRQTLAKLQLCILFSFTRVREAALEAKKKKSMDGRLWDRRCCACGRPGPSPVCLSSVPVLGGGEGLYGAQEGEGGMCPPYLVHQLLLRREGRGGASYGLYTNTHTKKKRHTLAIQWLLMKFCPAACCSCTCLRSFPLRHSSHCLCLEPTTCVGYEPITCARGRARLARYKRVPGRRPPP